KHIVVIFILLNITRNNKK
ncbi:unnamed protein product, partial [Onchocerca ochengi]